MLFFIIVFIGWLFFFVELVVLVVYDVVLELVVGCVCGRFFCDMFDKLDVLGKVLKIYFSV